MTERHSAFAKVSPIALLSSLLSPPAPSLYSKHI